MKKSDQTPSSSSSSNPSSVLHRKTPKLREHYTVGKKLGKGTYGDVYLCTDKSNGKDYACKSISKSGKREYRVHLREIEIMHHVSDLSNVVRIRDTYEDSESVHLVMELCEGGELLKWIMDKGPYSEKKAARLIKTIIEVVEGCHSLGVMHRDLKPENFLFVSNDEDAALKAIDFGLSAFYRPGEIFRDLVGSPSYLAPEVVYEHYGPEADIWSAGVILYILLSGVFPFGGDDNNAIFKHILRGNLDLESQPWQPISNSAKDLIVRMLDRDPKKRSTAHQVLCHPWIIGEGVAPEKPLDSAVLSRMKRFSAMNKLKKMALRVIAEKISEEEIGGLKKLFKMFDTENSGTITFDELKEGLRRVGSDLKEPEIQALMDAADIDNNGTIDCNEFLATTLHLNKLEREENLIKAFSFFDKDGSGYITVDDLSQACKDFGTGDVNLDELIKEIDENNDGQIDYSEFACMMRKQEEPCRRV
ncbi:uncharacterized protein A4U43_C02F7100 [Asparagus officinalis]|uniref:non-specific serine/threonine protein kinase n=1 Tax=Asparagus officinalis TaxID=4686 RepID=A0A5P1FLL7_ASPOF|nr:uncharacterized protein A4U43_C02F7100 [Asparagus officinalis]